MPPRQEDPSAAKPSLRELYDRLESLEAQAPDEGRRSVRTSVTRSRVGIDRRYAVMMYDIRRQLMAEGTVLQLAPRSDPSDDHANCLGQHGIDPRRVHIMTVRRVTSTDPSEVLRSVARLDNELAACDEIIRYFGTPYTGAPQMDGTHKRWVAKLLSRILNWYMKPSVDLAAHTVAAVRELQKQIGELRRQAAIVEHRPDSVQFTSGVDSSNQTLGSSRDVS